MCVLREIDGLKLHSNPEIAKKARKAAVSISKNLDDIEFVIEDPKGESADDQLLRITKEKEGCLVTNDVALKVRASALGIDNEGYSWKEEYHGIYYVDITNMKPEIYNSILADLYENGVYETEDYDFSCNEYLIIPPTTEDVTLKDWNIFRYNGEKFIPVTIRGFDSDYTDDGKRYIMPRNPEQVCLIDSLLNKNNKILYASGTFGVGKSFCTHHFAINQLQNGDIAKIVYIPNNSYTQDTLDLGALPGELFEKVQPVIGPLIDIVGIDEIKRWLDEDQLEIVPVNYIRGRNFTNAIIIVSEAENLTEEHIKLLIGRCGDNTRIFFDGDIPQADSAIFKDRNGLKLLLQLHNSDIYSRIFSTVHLVTIERSIVAAAADYLDKL